VPRLQLVIGNKNYSSWSMRPWVLMEGLGIPFEERKLSFGLGIDGGGFRAAMLPISPAARVPVLRDGALTVWDSLAIVEYLHERFPEHRVWPRDIAARARATSVTLRRSSTTHPRRQVSPEAQPSDFGLVAFHSGTTFQNETQTRHVIRVQPRRR